MPFGRHPACLCGTIVNDPAATVLRLVIDVALNIFANAFAKATGVELGADGRPVPPRKDALQDTHAALPFVRWNNWASYSRNLRLWQVPQSPIGRDHRCGSRQTTTAQELRVGNRV